MIRLLIPLLLFSLFLVVPVRDGSAAAPQLPQVSLLAPGGATISADQIGKDKGVLMVLAKKGNPGGIKLLDFLAALKPQFPAGRLLVVVSAADDKVLQAIAGRYPTLVADWYRDPDGGVAKGLKLTTTPAILGVRMGAVAWVKAGLTDEEEMEKLLNGWVGY